MKKEIYRVKTYICEINEESEQILEQKHFSNKDAAKKYFERAKEKLLQLNEVEELINETIPEYIQEGYDGDYIIDRADFYSVCGYDDDISYNVAIECVELYDEDDGSPVMLVFNY